LPRGGVLLPLPLGGGRGEGFGRWMGCWRLLRCWRCKLRLAGICARQRTYFLLRRQKKVGKGRYRGSLTSRSEVTRTQKAPPSLRPLRCAPGQTCVAALAGCAVELAAFTPLKQPPRVRPRTRASCGARATPQTLRRRRSHRGFKTIRAIAALGPGFGICRGRAQRWPEWGSLTPLAVPRSAGRGAGMGSAACPCFVL